MLKRTIKYTNYDDKPAEVTANFNLTKADLLKMEVSFNHGLGEHLQLLVDAQNLEAIVKFLDLIIDKAYGVRDLESDSFLKNEVVLTAFKQTEAYSALFMELTEDPNAAAQFLLGIVPKEMREEMERMEAGVQDKPTGPPPTPSTAIPPPPPPTA